MGGTIRLRKSLPRHAIKWNQQLNQANERHPDFFRGRLVRFDAAHLIFNYPFRAGDLTRVCSGVRICLLCHLGPEWRTTKRPADALFYNPAPGRGDQGSAAMRESIGAPYHELAGLWRHIHE